MGSTLHGKNRKNGNFDLNFMGMETLRYLGWGLKKKFGVYAPMSKEDCKILARILRNKVNLLELWQGSHTIQETYNIYMTFPLPKGQKDYLNDPETLQWIHKIADWFDNCGGLIPESGEEGEE